jgi:hypothetical protein
MRFQVAILSATKSRKVFSAALLGSLARANRRSISGMTHRTYQCDIDAEPLHRYRFGGYHPVKLGDLFQNGRYKIIHKAGWGGYSTTWAARDRM